MSAIATVLAAYRDILYRPARLICAGALPLVLAIAAYEFFSGSGLHSSLRQHADLDIAGLRPAATVAHLTANLPWIWFAAVFAVRWQRLAHPDEYRISANDAVWPLWHWRAFSILAAIALTAACAAMALHWAAGGIGLTSTGDDLATLVDSCSSQGGGSASIFEFPICAYALRAVRDRYLLEVQNLFYLMTIPVGAVVLSRLDLISNSDADGRNAPAAEGRHLGIGHTTRLWALVLVGAVAILLFLAVGGAAEAIPDETKTCTRSLLLLGPAETYECDVPGVFETRLLVAAEPVAFVFAVFGVAAVLSNTKVRGRGQRGHS